MKNIENQLMVPPPDIPWRSVVFPVAFFVLVLLGLSALLISWRIESVTLDLATARAWRQAKQVRDEINSSFRVGLSLYDMKNLPATLETKRNEEPEMIGALIIDELGATIAASGESQIRLRINPNWSEQLMGRRGAPLERSNHLLGSESLIGVNITDPSGRVTGVIWMLYSRTSIRQVSARVLNGLVLPSSLAGGLLLLIGVIGLYRLVRASEARMARLIHETEQAPPNVSVNKLMAERKL